MTEKPINREQLRASLTSFAPGCPQEARDRAEMLAYLGAHPFALERADEEGHFTASAWIVNPARTRVLMAYHNIYKAWTWIGGHADGEADLLAVALRETEEETGVRGARPVGREIFSLEIIPVPAHVKRGKPVAEHLHLNVTYLLEADENAALRPKPDENSGVRWRDISEVMEDNAEPCMLPVYRKLGERARRLRPESGRAIMPAEACTATGGNAMNRKIGWGVLGTASIGVRETFAAMREANNCRMVAIAGRDAQKAAEFAARYGFERSYGDFDALLSDPDVEAVYVPLPNSLHREWVARAARAGKHVLCEKPLSGTEADTRAMFEVCRENGVLLMEAFAYLHSPVLREALRRVEKGEIGETRMVHAAFYTRGYYDKQQNIRARRDTLGGSVYDIGVYNISLAHFFFGREPESARAVAHFTPLGVDDFCSEMLDFGQGRLGVLENGMCTHCARFSYFRVLGAEGWLDAPIGYNDMGPQTFYLKRPGKPDEAVTVDCPNNYTLEIEQFGRAVAGEEAPFLTEAFSLGVARTADKILAQINY